MGPRCVQAAADHAGLGAEEVRGGKEEGEREEEAGGAGGRPAMSRRRRVNRGAGGWKTEEVAGNRGNLNLSY